VKQQRTIGLHELVEGFLFSIRAEGKSLGTSDYYDYLLRPLLSFADQHNWSDDIRLINATVLREFLAWTATRAYEKEVANHGGRLARKSNPSTAWLYYRALRRLFSWAIEEGYLDSSPLATIHFKPPSERPVEGYTRDEVRRLLTLCELDIKTGARYTGVRNRAMFLLFIDAGLRRAEMANLRLSDLDLDKKLVRVIGKGNKHGVAPFSAKTAKALWTWLMERKGRAKTDYLWITEEGDAFSIAGLAY